MRVFITALVAYALLSSGLFAGGSPAFKFDSTIEAPARSLLERIDPDPPLGLGDAIRVLPSVDKPTPASRKAASAMPIINPAKEDTDYKLWVLAPNESIHYHLVIKVPDVDAAK